MEKVWLCVCDARNELKNATQKCFSGSSWQRCKVHFMRNILAHIPHKEKESFAAKLKQISSHCSFRRRTGRFLTIPGFPHLDQRKIASTNSLERIHKEIRRRTRVVGISPTTDSYLRLVTSYLVEYTEDWMSSKKIYQF